MRRLIPILACTLLLAACGRSAEPMPIPVRRHADLPPEQKTLVPVGSARAAKDIPASPFGTHTTVIAEGGDEATVAKLPDLIAAAGYKWVVDYAAAGKLAGLAPAVAAERWTRQRPRALRYAEQLQQRGVSLLVRLDPLPWSRMKDGEPTDEQVAGGAAFAAAVVHDLKPWVRHWQIWNEPNIGNDNPVVPAALYVRVAAAVAAAIRAEQAEAVIHGPGTAMLQCLAPTPLPWIDQALAAGLMKHLDVFSYHPYRQPYWRANLPEHASEFHPWNRWGSYEAQIADLRARLRAAAGREVPLSITEDGVPTFVNADGEQHLPPVVAAKYELRRDLLDAWLGVSPRVHFCFWRQMTNAGYESEASFNTLAGGELKPLYYAAQNLHGVLDGGHQPVVDSAYEWRMEGTAPGICTQVWRKQLPGVDELLVAFWAETEADTVHRRWRATLRLHADGYEAPRLFDLMAMPAPRMHGGMADLVNPEYRARKPALEPAFTAGAGGWLSTTGLEVRDYPQVLQLVRFR